MFYVVFFFFKLHSIALLCFPGFNQLIHSLLFKFVQMLNLCLLWTPFERVWDRPFELWVLCFVQVVLVRHDHYAVGVLWGTHYFRFSYCLCSYNGTLASRVWYEFWEYNMGHVCSFVAFCSSREVLVVWQVGSLGFWSREGQREAACGWSGGLWGISSREARRKHKVATWVSGTHEAAGGSLEGRR